MTLANGARIVVPAEHEKRAAYIVEVSIGLSRDSRTFDAGQLLVFKAGEEITLASPESHHARLMLLGGKPMNGPRQIWWNFVSRSSERIDQAKADWKAGRFASVPAETEFIRLPESCPVLTYYSKSSGPANAF